MNHANRPFHLAIPVSDLTESRRFYTDVLGCSEGRSADRWIDFNFFGHQLSTHLVESLDMNKSTNKVDGEDVPASHFGIILEMSDWKVLSEKLQRAGIKFVIEPTVRFAGQPGEQATLFLRDPSGNTLEFKSFADDKMIFAV